MDSDRLHKPGAFFPGERTRRGRVGRWWNHPRWPRSLSDSGSPSPGGHQVGLALNNRILTQQELQFVRTLEPTGFTHLDQGTLNGLSNQGSPSPRFTAAFDQGDTEFSHQFTAPEGGGANVGNGDRYTRVPRADLTGFGQWATHTPARDPSQRRQLRRLSQRGRRGRCRCRRRQRASRSEPHGRAESDDPAQYAASTRPRRRATPGRRDDGGPAGDPPGTRATRRAAIAGSRRPISSPKVSTSASIAPHGRAVRSRHRAR